MTDDFNKSDFNKSDFNKSGPATKSLDQLKGELRVKIISTALRQLAVSETQLNNLLSEDANINHEIEDFVRTLLGGSPGLLYINTDSLKKLQMQEHTLAQHNQRRYALL